MATESENQKSTATPSGAEKAAKENQKAADEVGADQVQAAFDEANEKGYFGELEDPTPRENYTLDGVSKGAPTPESDPEIRMAQPKRLQY